MSIKLNNGVEMPQLGLGVYELPAGDTTYNSVLSALKCGYRKIDTAHVYKNERDVARALKDSGVPRKDVWITSKLWINEFGAGKTKEAIDRMLARLGLEYIDLIYLHQPFGDVLGAWKDLEEAMAAKKVRALGICNFDYREDMFTDFVNAVTVKPQIIQVECHPYFQQKRLRELCKVHDIKLECWFPFGGRPAKGAIMKDPVITEIAAAHKKSTVQVILRWHLQEGFCVLPGSSNPAHIASNLDVFDFTLSDAEMERIRSLDKNKRFFEMTEDQARTILSGFVLDD